VWVLAAAGGCGVKGGERELTTSDSAAGELGSIACQSMAIPPFGAAIAAAAGRVGAGQGFRFGVRTGRGGGFFELGVGGLWVGREGTRREVGAVEKEGKSFFFG